MIIDNALFEKHEIPDPPPKPQKTYVIDIYDITRVWIEACSCSEALDIVGGMSDEEIRKEGTKRCGDLVFPYDDDLEEEED